MLRMVNLGKFSLTPNWSRRRRRDLHAWFRLLPPCAYFLVLLSVPAVSSVGGTDLPRTDGEFFEKSVRPLLVEKCWSCHGKAEKTKGGLRLSSRSDILKGGDSGPAAVAGDPAASMLVQAIGYEQEPKMPPAGKLKDREIDVLAR